MPRAAIAGLACLVLVLPSHGQAPEPPEALDGIDPVVLIEQGKEVGGKADYSVVRGPFRYLFASRESKAAFEADPAKYEIQFGGLCARMGGATAGNPADFLVHEGRIYVFGSDECHRRFAEAPSKYLPPPAASLDASGPARGAAAALIERASAALGGRERLAAVRTYVETASQVQERPSGPLSVTRVRSWRSPGDLREERTMGAMDRRFTITSIVAADGGWTAFNDGGFRPMLPAALSYAQVDAGRHPLALVRDGDGTRVAAAQAATLQGHDVEQVRIVRGPLDVTLGIDPGSGAPRTIAFVDRGPEGVYGQYVLVLSDYRPAGELRLPFRLEAFFNGEPEPSRSWTIESIQVNEPLDAALFEPGKGQ